MTNLSLRFFMDTDIERMAAWFQKAHVRIWYHDADDWLHEIRERNGEYAWIHHFIVMVDNKPIGFCQYYDCNAANHLEAWYHVPSPGETFSIDYLIGDEAYLGQGYGKAIVTLLTDVVRLAEKGKRIIVQPEKENKASGAVLLANGYEFDERLGYYCKTL